jgi:hypothetical protein
MIVKYYFQKCKKIALRSYFLRCNEEICLSIEFISLKKYFKKINLHFVIKLSILFCFNTKSIYSAFCIFLKWNIRLNLFRWIMLSRRRRHYCKEWILKNSEDDEKLKKKVVTRYLMKSSFMKLLAYERLIG